MNSIVRARASGTIPDTVSRWTLSTKVLKTMAVSETKIVSRVHAAPVHWLALDGIENRFLLSGGGDTSIQLFDLDPDRCKRSGSRAQRIKPAAHAPAGTGHAHLISCIEWYAVDTGMFTTSSYDCTVKVWDTNTMAEACQFDLLSRVYSHSMSPTGAHTLIAAVNESAYIRLCDLRTGSFAQSFLAHQTGAMAIAWSPAQPFVLASGGNDGKLKLWDIRRSDTQLFSFDRLNSALANTSNNGGSSGGDTCVAHEAAVNSVMFTNDGGGIISAGHDSKIQLWSTGSMRNALVTYQGTPQNSAPQAIEMAQTSAADGAAGNGVLFFPSSDCSVSMFELNTGKPVASLSGHFEPSTCAVWRPGSLELYSSGCDGEIIAWCLPAGDMLSKEQADIRQDCWSDSNSEMGDG
ncbi:WD40 repeat-like protein [Martensiomyces pterosporus]|nr:WD40 repeat-like protein [Martensiomyces pterosporus]